MHSSDHHTEAHGLKGKVLEHTGVNIAECYQCGKCTAGCPLNGEMDIMPNQILRMLQLELPGYEEKILRSEAIWLCLSCQMCYTRCPQEIGFAEVMDFLRQESIRCGLVHPKGKDILAFHQSFLGSIEKNGRLHEMGLIATYKMKTMNLLQDLTVAPSMLAKGKLTLLPHKIKNMKDIKTIFSKTAEDKGGKK